MFIHWGLYVLPTRYEWLNHNEILTKIYLYDEVRELLTCVEFDWIGFWKSI